VITTYLIGLYVPKKCKEGQKISIDPFVSIKVTALQKEILVASPTRRYTFVEEVRRRLKEEYPEMVGHWAGTHNLNVLDPHKGAHQYFIGYIEQLQNGATSEVMLDLTDYEVSLKH